MAKLIGIDSFRLDFVFGIGLGILMIVSNILGFFSLATPPVLNLLTTNVGRFMVIVLIAPIVEEIFFRSIMLRLVQNRTKSFLIGAVVQAFVFAGFHLVAYTGVVIEALEVAPILAVGGAFFSAFLFGLGMAFAVNKTNNLLTSMIPHAMINFWLVRGLLVIV